MIAAQATAALGAGLLVGHAAFDVFKITFTLGCLALLRVDAPARRTYVKMRRRNFHIRADLVVEAELLVNVGSCNLAGCNGADGSRRSRHAVAAGKDGFHVVDLAGAFCHEGSPADGDTGLFKACNLDALTDCYNDDICRDAFFGLIGSLRTGTAGLGRQSR